MTDADRKPGRTKLVYDKAAHRIVPVSTPTDADRIERARVALRKLAYLPLPLSDHDRAAIMAAFAEQECATVEAERDALRAAAEKAAPWAHTLVQGRDGRSWSVYGEPTHEHAPDCPGCALAALLGGVPASGGEK